MNLKNLMNLMNLVEVNDRLDWEQFQSTQPWPQFTQSWAWGEFRKQAGCKVLRFALKDETGKWRVAAQMEYRRRKMGLGYWFAARGPVVAFDVGAEERRELFETFVHTLEERGRLAKALFWRWEPPLAIRTGERPLPPRFEPVPENNPASTLVLDLNQSEEALLAGMHQKTRYNIKVAERHGVQTRVTSHPSDLDRFMRLMDETAERDKFVQHPPHHLVKTFHTLASANMARLRVAELNGAMLAADMEVTYGNTVTYLYGASSHLMRQAMTPYKLHWDAIRAAKAEGKAHYDFWGVNPPTRGSLNYKATWEGISRFKHGWGGGQVDLIGTWDMPTNQWLYRLAFLPRILFNKVK